MSLSDMMCNGKTIKGTNKPNRLRFLKWVQSKIPFFSTYEFDIALYIDISYIYSRMNLRTEDELLLVPTAFVTKHSYVPPSDNWKSSTVKEGFRMVPPEYSSALLMFKEFDLLEPVGVNNHVMDVAVGIPVTLHVINWDRPSRTST